MELQPKYINLLRNYRKKQGLSQMELARRLGFNTSVLISRWEKGEVHPSIINACKLSKLYDLPLDSLFADLLASVEIKKV